MPTLASTRRTLHPGSGRAAIAPHPSWNQSLHRTRGATTERLAEAQAVASVGSRGDSYDNAMAEALNSLFNGELNPLKRGRSWQPINEPTGPIVDRQQRCCSRGGQG